MTPRTRKPRPSFVLRRLKAGERPHYYRTMVGKDPILTDDLYKAAVYTTREEAYKSEACQSNVYVLVAEERP